MALNRKPVTVLWNSAAGWSDSDEQVRQVESILSGDGAPVTVFRIQKGEDITSTARRLVSKGAEVLVAAGGDGTVNGVATALVHSAASLAVIPAGTLNHFARDLSIPLDVAGAAECARNGHPIETDVGCVNDRIFINNSVLGLYPLYRAAREAYERSGLGRNRITQFFAVVRAVLRVLWHLPHLKLQLQMEDGGVMHVETPFVLVANNEHEVENWNIGHRTSLNKGHLWVYVMRRCSRWAVMRFFASFLFKRFSRREAFDIYRTRAVTVDTKAAHLRVGVDGEIVRMETPLQLFQSAEGAASYRPPELPAGCGRVMRRVVQISDIHFGNNDVSLLAPLCEAIVALQPHVLVISGDLVEHATVAEFIQARDFLATLPKPQIVVPGNHDLPFYNFFERAVMGLSRYKKYITTDTSPEYRDEEIFIVGANTSRVWPLRGGSLSSTQLERLEAQFSAVPETLTRMLVTHHPFDLPEDQESHLIVGHARRSIAALAPFVDVLLAGHIHLSSSGSTAARYKTQGHALAFVQAGTCVSNRNKGENNSFNFMRVGDGLSGEKAAVVERYSWDKEQRVFKKQDSEEYQLGKAGWARCEANKEAEVVAATPTEAP